MLAWLWCASVLVFLIGCEKKITATEAANQFFALLSKDKTRTAYDSSTFAFQAQQSFGNFEITVKELGLIDYASLNWTRTVINEKDTALDGIIVTKKGVSLPVAITMLKDGRGWKLYSMHTAGEGEKTPSENRFSLVGKGAAFDDAFNRDIPNDPAIQALVMETMNTFNTAIKKKNFADFYNYVALAWQQQLSEVRLQRAFQPFIDAQVNLGGFAQVKPVLDQKPQLNSEGMLIVTGYFPTQPYRIVFTFRYVYELPKWRLFGLDLDLVK